MAGPLFIGSYIIGAKVWQALHHDCIIVMFRERKFSPVILLLLLLLLLLLVFWLILLVFTLIA